MISMGGMIIDSVTFVWNFGSLSFFKYAARYCWRNPFCIYVHARKNKPNEYKEQIGLIDILIFTGKYIAQKMKFSIKDFFSKCDQIRTLLRIRSHLLKKSLMENFIFYAVITQWLPRVSWYLQIEGMILEGLPTPIFLTENFVLDIFLWDLSTSYCELYFIPRTLLQKWNNQIAENIISTTGYPEMRLQIVVTQKENDKEENIWWILK